MLKIIVMLIMPVLAHAQNDNQLIVINHFDKKLDFIISVNQDVIPDFSSVFTLNPGEIIQSRVINLQKEAYLLAEDHENHSAFWGVEIENNRTKIHGYTSKGLAYSWNKHTIIFCTPEDYRKKNQCL